MARANPDINYIVALQDLRNTYPKLKPSQRLHIIRQRLEDHHFGPNRLVTSVSAVEALARSLVMHHEAKGNDKEALDQVYRRYKSSSAKDLVTRYVKVKLDVSPSIHFGQETWSLFRYAEDFRNLVVHECTYLGMDKFPSLIDACDEILNGLVKIGNIRERRT